MRAKLAALRTLTQVTDQRFEDQAISMRLAVRVGDTPRNPAELAGSLEDIQAQIAALEAVGVHEVALDFSAAQPWPRDVEALERCPQSIGQTPCG